MLLVLFIGSVAGFAQQPAAAASRATGKSFLTKIAFSRSPSIQVGQSVTWVSDLDCVTNRIAHRTAVVRLASFRRGTTLARVLRRRGCSHLRRSLMNVCSR